MPELKKYKVQQMAEVWWETEVEAESESDAIRIGSLIIMSGKGTQLDGSHEYTDNYFAMAVTNKQNEGEENE